MLTYTFQTADGLNLHGYLTEPPQPSAQAFVIVVHGLGDYGQALPYRYLTTALTARGFAVASYDQRGHGQSGGERLYLKAWSDFQTDLRLFVEWVKQQSGPRPIFLLGLSLGGLVVLDYARQFPAGLSGVVAVAPAVDSSGVSPLLRALIPFIARLAPRLSLNLGLDLNRISRDVGEAQAYAADGQLMLGKSTPRMAAAILQAIETVQTQAAAVQTPLLILHGGADTIVPPAGSAEFFQKVSSVDKQRRVYEGAYHNLFLETNRDQVFAEIVDWLSAHC